MTRKKPWQGSFKFKSQEDLVVRQIIHNADFWGSDICKRSTLEKYCREKGLADPGKILNGLIRKGLVHSPKKGYVGLKLGKVGHAEVYENIIVYGKAKDLGKRKRSQLGAHLGTVKAVIPEDPHHVLYEHLKISPAFKQRQKIRKHLKKIGLRKRELRSQRRL